MTTNLVEQTQEREWDLPTLLSRRYHKALAARVDRFGKYLVRNEAKHRRTPESISIRSRTKPTRPSSSRQHRCLCSGIHAAHDGDEYEKIDSAFLVPPLAHHAALAPSSERLIPTSPSFGLPTRPARGLHTWSPTMKRARWRRDGDSAFCSGDFADSCTWQPEHRPSSHRALMRLARILVSILSHRVLPSLAPQLSQPSIAPELPEHGAADHCDEP
jgi:hypothetical protein